MFVPRMLGNGTRKSILKFAVGTHGMIISNFYPNLISTDRPVRHGPDLRVSVHNSASSRRIWLIVMVLTI